MLNINILYDFNIFYSKIISLSKYKYCLNLYYYLFRIQLVRHLKTYILNFKNNFRQLCPVCPI
jgi:hypothetical protein